jgi:predicted transposase YbfD/YdcC
MTKKSVKIQEIRELMAEHGATCIEQIDIESLRDLREVFESLEDKRFEPYVEHLLSDIVMITLIGVLANADEWSEIAAFARAKAEWLKSFLTLPNGIPSHDTIQRVMSMIDGSMLYSLSIQFLVERIDGLAETGRMLKGGRGAETGGGLPEIVAIDGKTSRGSKRKKADRDAAAAMHTVSAFSTERGLGLSEVVVEEKSNEIPAVKDLLDITNIRGCIVTWDAMNTQKETVRAVIAKKGDYVGALKGNQQSFYEDVALYFDKRTLGALEGSAQTYLKTVDKEQSGIGIREYYLTQDIQWLFHQDEWAGLKSIGCVRRTLEKFNGERIVEVRYFIASITDIEYFAKAVRGHWQVENKLHWHLDYTFGDDRNTTMRKHGAQNLQTMKRVALAILSLVQTAFDDRSLKGIRFILALSFERHIETIFKLLNAQAIRNLLLPHSS